MIQPEPGGQQSWFKRPAAWARDARGPRMSCFTQGDFSQTNNPLDVVIQVMLLQVLQPNGTLAYTRAGQFQVNARERRRRQRQPPAAEHFAPAKRAAITIAPMERQLTRFPTRRGANRGTNSVGDVCHPAGLNSLGQNYYQPTTASANRFSAPRADRKGSGTCCKAFTEQSNVSVVNEFVNLIISQRAYEANSKVVKASDEMYQEMNNLTR